MITISGKKSCRWLIFAAATIVLTGLLAVIVMNIKSIFFVADGTLRGRVLDENKKTVRNAQVYVYLPDSQQTVRDRTDWFGRFELTGLPDAKTLSVTVINPEYGQQGFNGLTTGHQFDLQIFRHGYGLFGKQAPPLQVEKWFNSQPQSLQQLRGKVVLLNVGIHADDYDRYNRKVLQTYKKYAGRNLAVIAVYVNSQGSWHRPTSGEEISAYLKENDIDFPVGLDEAEVGTHGATYKSYGAKSPPARFLVDKKGILRCSPTDENLETWILRLLAE